MGVYVQMEWCICTHGVSVYVTGSEVTDLKLRKTRLKTAFTKTKNKTLYLVNFEDTLDKKQCQFQQNKLLQLRQYVEGEALKAIEDSES